ncbi:ABC transporter permease [Tersicoccus phoenicis]|uniref:ABC transporter permease n=1 Tax=Tersicoccus phoenicis TaxID=554083 RepID=UPI001F278DBC|nr:ABC transporter permease [Tersicoccus phoenicis]
MARARGTQRGRRPGTAHRLLHRPIGLAALTVLTLVVLAALVSLVWTPYDPMAASPRLWDAPGPDHWFGTDQIGRDIFSRVLVGSRVAVQVAVLSALLAAVVGLVFGALSTLTTRWVREPVAVVVDVLIAFPTLLIAMMLAATFGGSLTVVVVAVGIGYGVGASRVLRSEFRVVAGADYVLAAEAAGLTRTRILARHILPNIAPAFIVQLSLTMALSQLAEAGLSYLGYGAPTSVVSWGRMLAEMQDHVTTRPLAAFWPGAAIAVTVLALNLLGDALREATDPTLGTSRSSRRRGSESAGSLGLGA